LGDLSAQLIDMQQLFAVGIILEIVGLLTQISMFRFSSTNVTCKVLSAMLHTPSLTHFPLEVLEQASMSNPDTTSHKLCIHLLGSFTGMWK
jgi:hypothetical protein